jgi:threonine/homoserine efflux transporter RhtA
MRKRWWTLAAVLLIIAASIGGTMYLKRPKKAPQA